MCLYIYIYIAARELDHGLHHPYSLDVSDFTKLTSRHPRREGLYKAYFFTPST